MRTKFYLFAFLGSLILLYGEVWTGSSALPPWFLEIDTYILFPITAFPLYLAHSLFYLNLAYKTKRFSIPHLYLWGMVFGLYESWLTKILWINPGQDFVIAGVNWTQTLILVFFWHPIFSFIMPILLFQIIFGNKNGKIFSVHHVFLKNTSRNKNILLIFVSVTGIFFSTITLGGNLLFSIFSVIGNILIILIFYKLLTRTVEKSNIGSISVENLIISNRSFRFLTGYLIVLYIIDYFIYNYDAAPRRFGPYLQILIITAILILLIWLSPRNETELIISEDLIPTKIIGIHWIVMLVGLIISLIILPIVSIFGFIYYVLVLLTSFFLFLFALKAVFF